MDRALWKGGVGVGGGGAEKGNDETWHEYNLTKDKPIWG